MRFGVRTLHMMFVGACWCALTTGCVTPTPAALPQTDFSDPLLDSQDDMGDTTDGGDDTDAGSADGGGAPLHDDCGGTPPVFGAIAGGRSDDGTALYYCLAVHTDKSLQPGKYVTTDQKCHYSYMGVELTAGAGQFSYVVAPSGVEPLIIDVKDYGRATTSCPNVYAPVGADSDGTKLPFCSATIESMNAPLSSGPEPGKLRNLGTSTCYSGYLGHEYLSDALAESPVRVLVFYPTGDGCIFAATAGGYDNFCP